MTFKSARQRRCVMSRLNAYRNREKYMHKKVIYTDTAGNKIAVSPEEKRRLEQEKKEYYEDVESYSPTYKKAQKRFHKKHPSYEEQEETLY